MARVLKNPISNAPIAAPEMLPKPPVTTTANAKTITSTPIPGIKTKNRAKLPTIEGSIPHPFNRPKGCLFYQRCVDAIAGTCNQTPPELLPFQKQQYVSCLKYDGKSDAF